MSSKKKIFVLVVMVFFVPTGLFSIYRGVRKFEVEKLLNTKYRIDTLIQTGPVKEALPTVLLSELIDLSCDKPTNYFAFEEKRAEKKLLNCPVIAKAVVKKIKPNQVYIDYELRRPVALLGDFQNMVIDEERRLFPLAPYFSPKQLPEILLGEHRFCDIITGEKIELAYEVLVLLDKAGLDDSALIKKVDVSRAFSKSYGKREIVVVVKQKSEQHYLRLSQKSLESGIANYVSLVAGLEGQGISRVIDLRIEKLAYVEDLKE